MSDPVKTLRPMASDIATQDRPRISFANPDGMTDQYRERIAAQSRGDRMLSPNRSEIRRAQAALLEQASGASRQSLMSRLMRVLLISAVALPMGLAMWGAQENYWLVAATILVVTVALWAVTRPWIMGQALGVVGWLGVLAAGLWYAGTLEVTWPLGQDVSTFIEAQAQVGYQSVLGIPILQEALAVLNR